MNIVMFTSCEKRHQAFAAIANNSPNTNVLRIYEEQLIPLYNRVHTQNGSALQLMHLTARAQSESDMFDLFLQTQADVEDLITKVPKGWFSTRECIMDIIKLQPDLIVVYGSSIIKGSLISMYSRKILNVHLGLSPYYRGSGTNYFPFVNNEPEYCGATFMYLDDGIDTGEIIHQIRPLMLPLDSFQQLSNRFLLLIFKVYLQIIENFNSIKSLSTVHSTNKSLNNRTRYLYKRSDFTNESLESLNRHFRLGMLEDYIASKVDRDNKVPIIVNDFFANSGSSV
jgi:phosphoribosylglycinamide formyltransferase-1